MSAKIWVGQRPCSMLNPKQPPSQRAVCPMEGSAVEILCAAVARACIVAAARVVVPPAALAATLKAIATGVPQSHPSMRTPLDGSVVDICRSEVISTRPQCL
jgi:hypothetical protein